MAAKACSLPSAPSLRRLGRGLSAPCGTPTIETQATLEIWQLRAGRLTDADASVFVRVQDSFRLNR